VLQIGVVGDYQSTYEPHIATGAAIGHASNARGLPADAIWVGTEEVAEGRGEILKGYDGLIIAPGSPYRSQQGALVAIEHARIHDLPLLGTCGGFQHVVLEFARNVLGFADAQHAEYDPYASRLFVSPLSCSVAGRTMTVHVNEGTRAAAAYCGKTATEKYYCNFGLNPTYLDMIVRAGLEVTGTDQDGEPRILELPDRQFFVATLFVPQTSSTQDSPHPIIVSLIAAADAHRGRRTSDP
jgi:CTP synthase (UTP-ammonia lyase)